MKTSRSVIMASTLCVGLPLLAKADWTAPTPTDGKVPTDLAASVGKATNWLLGFVGLIAVLMIIWGGFQYLTSAGNQDQAKSGKDTIKFAVMGLAIAGIAWALVHLITNTVLTK